MTDPEFPLCSKSDPRVPVVYNMLRKSQLMGGTFTLDARRILAALDDWDAKRLGAAIDRLGLRAPHSPAEPVSPVSTPTEAHGETGEAHDG